MKILALANLYNLEKVRQGCIDLLRNMRLESLSETVHLQDLDKEKAQYYLTQRIERLETVLDQVYPQIFGLVGSLIWFVHDSGKLHARCSKHVSEAGKYCPNLGVIECLSCQGMSRSMVRATCSRAYGKQTPFHGCHVHFDENLFSVMEDLSKVTGKKR